MQITESTPSSKKGFYCQHLKTKQYSNGLQNCLECGVHIPDDGTRVFKTIKQSYGVAFNPHNFYKNIQKKRLDDFSLSSSSYCKNRKSTVEFIFNVAEKLKLSLKSIHLAVQMLDYCISQDSQLVQKLQLYASVSLLIAAKAIEKDERIPFIPQLRTKAAPTYNLNEYKSAEQNMIKILQFNVQLPTLLDFLDFYTAQGIVFSDDSIDGIPITNDTSSNSSSPSSKEDILSPKNCSTPNAKYQIKLNLKTNWSEGKLLQRIQRIEKDVRRLSNALIKDEKSLEYEPKILAAACIAFIRQMHNISTPWHTEIQLYAGISNEDIRPCLSSLFTSYENAFKQTSYISDSPSTKATLTPKSPYSPFVKNQGYCAQAVKSIQPLNLNNNYQYSRRNSSNTYGQNYQGSITPNEGSENSFDQKYQAYISQLSNKNIDSIYQLKSNQFGYNQNRYLNNNSSSYFSNNNNGVNFKINQPQYTSGSSNQYGLKKNQYNSQNSSSSSSNYSASGNPLPLSSNIGFTRQTSLPLKYF